MNKYEKQVEECKGYKALSELDGIYCVKYRMEIYNSCLAECPDIPEEHRVKKPTEQERIKEIKDYSFGMQRHEDDKVEEMLKDFNENIDIIIEKHKTWKTIMGELVQFKEAYNGKYGARS